jgi:hypothetical protein
MKGKWLIYVTIAISMVTYLFWEVIKEKTGIKIFFLGNAISVFLMAIVIFIQNKRLFASFYLLCITFQNLLDELFFNPIITSSSEIIFAIILPIFWLIKTYKICLINWLNKNFRN